MGLYWNGGLFFWDIYNTKNDNFDIHENPPIINRPLDDVRIPPENVPPGNYERPPHITSLRGGHNPYTREGYPPPRSNRMMEPRGYHYPDPRGYHHVSTEYPPNNNYFNMGHHPDEIYNSSSNFVNPNYNPYLRRSGGQIPMTPRRDMTPDMSYNNVMRNPHEPENRHF